MKRLLLGILSIVLLISCTVKSETPTDTEQTVLKIGAIKDFKRSLEGSTLVFDTLLQMTLDYKPLPNIITEWTRNDTATEYHLTIRDDILFSDGTPLTAQTVKWDIENVAPITYCVFSSLLKEVSITDTTHLKISLTAPYYFLPQDLALVTAIKENGVDEALNITDFIGTGAYILKEYDEGQSASLIKNENYWNKAAAPSIPQVEWLVITDDNARNSALSSGQIDVLGISEHYLSIQYPLIDDLIKAKKMSFFEEPKDAFTSLMTISFNWKEGFCSDKALREALEYGINRQALVDTVFFGIPQASGHQFNPAFTDGPQNEKPYTYNPEFSKTLLAEAGYPDGKDFPVMTIIYNTHDGHKLIAEYVQEAWKQNLGITIDIQNYEWKTFLDVRHQHDFDISRAGWIGDYQDPNNFLEIFQTGHGINDGEYSNPKFDELVRKAATMKGGSERFQVLHDAEAVLLTEDQGMLPIYSYVSQSLIDTTKWDGWYNNPQDAHPYFGIKKVK